MLKDVCIGDVRSRHEREIERKDWATDRDKCDENGGTDQWALCLHHNPFTPYLHWNEAE